jgi:hypothetical protein
MNLRIAGRVLFPALVTLAAASTSAAPQFPFGEQATLWGTGDAIPDAYESFGDAVALDGDTLVVGAPGHNGTARGSGIADVFVRGGGAWTREATLVPSRPLSGFGASVAISGDTVVVGVPRWGAAFVFVRAGGVWTEQAELANADDARLFGRSVSVVGDVVAVGAPDASFPNIYDVGAAYVFARTGTTWALQQRLVAADAAAGDDLGASVSLSGTSLAVGSPKNDAAGTNAGAAYVFVSGGATWTQQAKLAGTGEPAPNSERAFP